MTRMENAGRAFNIGLIERHIRRVVRAVLGSPCGWFDRGWVASLFQLLVRLH